MSATGLAIIYIIIWWVVFFARSLPIDVNQTIEPIKIECQRMTRGAPENPKMLKKIHILY